MSAVLEQYFQLVVVDKINELISKQFDEIKDDLSKLKKLDSNYTTLRIEIESLKKRVSDSGEEIYGKIHDDLKGMLEKNGKRPAAAKKQTTAKKPIAKPVAKKAPVKKAPVKKSVTKK